ncbi:MAG: hypothetical protein QNJ75_00345 [Acidimicrobiia bacterium]|nr:hypothetical protein [Acidimicrobiia bacterium]
MGNPPRGIDLFFGCGGRGLGSPLHPPRELFTTIDDPAGKA